MKRKGLFLLAKFIILVVTILHVIPVVWDLPASYRQLRMLQPNSGLSGWTQTELQSAAQSAGLSPRFLGTVLFTASLTCLLAFWVMAGLMYWFKGNSWIGLLSMYILSGTGVGFAFLIIDRAVLPGWATGFYNFTAASLWPTFFMLIYLFPDGHFVPRWSRFLAPFPFIVFVFAAWYGDEKTPGWFLGLLLLYLLGGLISQSYRYRRASSAEQRQQTKWVFYAMAVLVVNVILGKVAPLLFPALAAKTGAGFYFDVGYNYLLGVLFSALLPISIGFSILRYRLWDIDVLIRRTL
ncbi:MAG: hypothetical protein EHM70_11325, partial [Chloroflexota bacterium]